MADVGLPDGAGASLVYRPMKWLRVTGGGTYNMISSGLRAGASLLPFGWGPSLTVEGGHYFDGDANGLVRKFAGSSYQSNAVLERVGYDYANAHLGLDLGYRRVTFFIHGGMSFIRASVHNIDQAIQSDSDRRARRARRSPSSRTRSSARSPLRPSWASSSTSGNRHMKKHSTSAPPSPSSPSPRARSPSPPAPPAASRSTPRSPTSRSPRRT